MAGILPFLLLLLALAVILRIDVFFTIVWLLLGLYVLSRLWVRRAVQHLRVVRHFTDRVFSGEEVPVDLVIKNGSRLPVPWLEVSESIPLDLREGLFPEQVVALKGREERHFRYTLHGRRRGYYQLGPLRLQTGDLLGVDERYLNVPEPRRLIVYPRVVPLQRLGLPTRSALVTLPARTPLFEDTSRILGIRDYRPGDSPRRMHWPATARTGRLVVKQYQPAIARETLLCLDLDLAAYMRQRQEGSEMAVVVAASLANHMVVQEGLPVGLATEAIDPLVGGERRRLVIPPHEGRAQLMAILEVLARVQLAPGHGFAQLLRQESFHLAWGATLVAITGSVDDELAATLLYLKRSGHAAAVILVQPDVIAAGQEMGSLAGVPVYRVWTDRELVGVR